VPSLCYSDAWARGSQSHTPSRTSSVGSLLVGPTSPAAPSSSPTNSPRTSRKTHAADLVVPLISAEPLQLVFRTGKPESCALIETLNRLGTRKTPVLGAGRCAHTPSSCAVADREREGSGGPSAPIIASPCGIVIEFAWTPPATKTIGRPSGIPRCPRPPPYNSAAAGHCINQALIRGMDHTHLVRLPPNIV
jgi:hypothetical protein